jgi:hypothetical protein
MSAAIASATRAGPSLLASFPARGPSGWASAGPSAPASLFVPPNFTVILRAGSDRIITYGGGLLGFVPPNLKASLIYEHPAEQGSNKVNNDLFTAQLQANF